MIREIELDELKEKIKTGSVLLYVSAEWCGQCKMTERPLSEIAEENDIKVLKIDVDKNELWKDDNNEIEVLSVPTFIAYKNNEKIFEEKGFKSKIQLQEIVDKFN